MYGGGWILTGTLARFNYQYELPISEMRVVEWQYVRAAMGILVEPRGIHPYLFTPSWFDQYLQPFIGSFNILRISCASFSMYQHWEGDRRYVIGLFRYQREVENEDLLNDHLDRIENEERQRVYDQNSASEYDEFSDEVDYAFPF